MHLLFKAHPVDEPPAKVKAPPKPAKASVTTNIKKEPEICEVICHVCNIIAQINNRVQAWAHL